MFKLSAALSSGFIFLAYGIANIFRGGESARPDNVIAIFVMAGIFFIFGGFIAGAAQWLRERRQSRSASQDR